MKLKSSTIAIIYKAHKHEHSAINNFFLKKLHRYTYPLYDFYSFISELLAARKECSVEIRYAKRIH